MEKENKEINREDNSPYEDLLTRNDPNPNDKSDKSSVLTGKPCPESENISELVIENVHGNYSGGYENFIEANEDVPIVIEEHPIKKEKMDKEPSVDSSSRVTLKRKSDSLALISSYDISSESEDEIITSSFSKPQDPVEIIDSNSESDSDSGSLFNSESDASNESSQSSDEEATGDKNPKKKKSPPTGAVSNKLMSCLDLGELPPIKDLQISVKEEECLPFGKVHSIVETLVVIESLPDVPALNLDSVLFTKTGEPLGEVFDVFGPIKRPYYTLRFKDEKDIEEKSLSVGVLVYCAPQTKYTQYVFIHQLASMKGSDASWRNDVEPPPEFLDYSDDEQEKTAKKVLREAKIKAKALKVIDVDAPPLKIPTFEERMNQKNTLRNLMFIREPSPESRQKDWYQSGSTGSRDPGGSSGSTSSGRGRGGLIRSPGFTLPFHQIAVTPPPPSQFYSQSNRPAFNRLFSSPHFQSSSGLAPGGFVASRALYSGRGSFVSDQAQNVTSNPFGPPHSNNPFGQVQNSNPFGQAQNRHQFGQNLGHWQVPGGHQFNTTYGPPQPNTPPFGLGQCGQGPPNGPPSMSQVQPPNRFQGQNVQRIQYNKQVLHGSVPHYGQRPISFPVGANMFLSSPPGPPPRPFSGNSPTGPTHIPFPASSPPAPPPQFATNNPNIPPSSFPFSPNQPPQPGLNVPFRSNMYSNSPMFRGFSQN